MSSYPGGKAGSGVYQRIINRMPPHDVYVEPFAGGAAVALRKKPARLTIVADLDSAALFEAGQAWRAAHGFAPVSSSGDRIAAILARGSGTESFGNRFDRPVCLLHHGSAFGVLEALGAALVHVDKPYACIYLDPPYLRATRRRAAALYDHELSSDEHRLMLSSAQRLAKPAHVLISGYRHALYDRALKGWHREEFDAMTRRGLAREVLWCSFPPPDRLHDYRFLGENFRERQRLKKLQARWRAKLERMPALERQALMAILAGAALQE